jgi:LacI family transcriptional regulator
VFAVTDMLALGVLDAASDARLRVPRDLSVVGFDDIPAASHSHPPLTTMSQSLRGQGQHAARMALAMIAGRRARVPVVTSEVVVRGTTAPPTTP